MLFWKCIYAYLVLHICAYFVHIYAYGMFAYMCIFCFCIFQHIWPYYTHILRISYLHIPAYSYIFGTAYYCISRAYFLDLHILICIQGHITLIHIQKYNTYFCIQMYIYAYFWLFMHIYWIFLICIFVQISCIFGTTYFMHISAYFNLHIMACFPLCIFQLISAYLHLLCLPRPISLKILKLLLARNASCSLALIDSSHQGCSQQCWTVESAAAAGTLYWFPHASCTSCICQITLPPCRCNYVQSTWDCSLSAGAPRSLPRVVAWRLADKG